MTPGSTAYATVGSTILTAADIAAGYVDVPVHIGSFQGWNVLTAVTPSETSPHFALGLATHEPAPPTIRAASDDQGPQTGPVANGGTTDDATPTITIFEEGLPPKPQGSPGHAPYGGNELFGATVELREGSTLIGTATMGYDGLVDITSAALAPGFHNLTAVIIDRAGNPSVPSAPFGVTIAADGSGGSGSGGQVLNSDQYGDTLIGGAGGDTLNAGRGPDQLTGGGGADDFAFAALPWNAGHVTDFAAGSDRLDLSALLRDAGYTGADPIVDHYVILESDGAGGTRVLVDTNGAASGGDWPFLITTLDHVSPGGLTWAQLSGGGGTAQSPPPPDGGGGGGQVINSSQYGDTLTGGAGNDTLNAGRGPDQLTGGDGADHFAWAAEPWNAGHVTDFRPGIDKLDLRALLHAYTGADPIADHWMELRTTLAGTQVYIDTDGPSGPSPYMFLITTLDHVQAAQLNAGDWIIR
jgi:hypothetical protein